MLRYFALFIIVALAPIVSMANDPFKTYARFYPKNNRYIFDLRFKKDDFHSPNQNINAYWRVYRNIGNLSYTKHSRSLNFEISRNHIPNEDQINSQEVFNLLQDDWLSYMPENLSRIAPPDHANQDSTGEEIEAPPATRSTSRFTHIAADPREVERHSFHPQSSSFVTHSRGSVSLDHLNRALVHSQREHYFHRSVHSNFSNHRDRATGCHSETYRNFYATSILHYPEYLLEHNSELYEIRRYRVSLENSSIFLWALFRTTSDHDKFICTLSELKNNLAPRVSRVNGDRNSLRIVEKNLPIDGMFQILERHERKRQSSHQESFIGDSPGLIIYQYILEFNGSHYMLQLEAFLDSVRILTTWRLYYWLPHSSNYIPILHIPVLGDIWQHIIRYPGETEHTQRLVINPSEDAEWHPTDSGTNYEEPLNYLFNRPFTINSSHSLLAGNDCLELLEDECDEGGAAAGGGAPRSH